MKDFLQKVPPFFKSFYFIVGALFLVWMLIFDSNDIVTQIKLSKKQKELSTAKEFYEEKIIEVKEDREALLNNDDLLEKVARERYYMKKPGEDVFVVVEED